MYDVNTELYKGLCIGLFVVLIVSAVCFGSSFVTDTTDTTQAIIIEDLTTESTTEAPTVKARIETATEVETTEAAYEMYFTESDVVMVAQTIYGEAGSSWISREDKACVAWVICNRVDEYVWGNSIYDVITAPNQFHGYSEYHPVTTECYDIAKDVLTRWSLEKQGVAVERELEHGIDSFYGDGHANHFYAAN